MGGHPTGTRDLEVPVCSFKRHGEFANILQKLGWQLPNGVPSPSTMKELAVEVTAMAMLARRLRFERSILWGPTGVLLAELAITVPMAAQSSEQKPSTPDSQAEVLAENQKALEANPRSSLAYYHIAEVLFSRRSYQASVNSCRSALRGDGIPSWTKVWCHIQMGEIFDLTGQRDRAVNEYRLAVQTGDNTRGALSTRPENCCKSSMFGQKP